MRAVLISHRIALQKCFLCFASADTDLDDSHTTMNLREFFMFAKCASLLDSYLSLPRMLEIFMQVRVCFEVCGL